MHQLELGRLVRGYLKMTFKAFRPHKKDLKIKPFNFFHGPGEVYAEIKMTEIIAIVDGIDNVLSPVHRSAPPRFGLIGAGRLPFKITRDPTIDFGGNKINRWLG